MTYYISAWIVSGGISSVEADTNPITENHMPDLAHDFRVIAEVAGDYQDAGVIFPLLGWDGEALTGLDFISQVVEQPTEPR